MDSRLKPSANIGGTLLIKTTSLQKPDIVGVFSSERSETEIRLDASNCKYLKKQLVTNANSPIDLKVYDDKRKAYENSRSEKCDHLPMALFLEYLEKLVMQDTFVRYNANQLFKADIICNAKVLTKLFMVHGDVNETFSLICTKYKGNIYICKQKKKTRKMDNKKPIRVIAKHALYSGALNFVIVDVQSIGLFMKWDCTERTCVIDLTLTNHRN